MLCSHRLHFATHGSFSTPFKSYSDYLSSALLTISLFFANIRFPPSALSDPYVKNWEVRAILNLSLVYYYYFQVTNFELFGWFNDHPSKHLGRKRFVLIFLFKMAVVGQFVISMLFFHLTYALGKVSR